MTEPGRNDPCPCGSGKKYKKCCLPKSCSPIGIEESIRSRLVKEVLAFSKRYYNHTFNEAYWYYWDDFVPEEYLDTEALQWADINFCEWFVFDWRPDEKDQKTLVELYMEKKERLTPDEISVLNKMKDAVLNLYEVQEVFLDKGLVLKDLLLGGEYKVKERLATRNLKKWDIFAARLLYIDGNYIISGSSYPYPIRDKVDMIKHLKECFNKHKKTRPSDTMRDFLKLNGDLFNYYWYYNIRHPFMPILSNSSGEPFLFSKAFFDIKDKEAVLRGLAKLKEMEKVGEGLFQWLNKQGDSDTATILGTVKINDNSLVVECNSKERLEKGKALILKHFSDLVAHKMDKIEDPYQALKAYQATKGVDKAQQDTRKRIPRGVEQQLCTEFMRRHYEKWLNMKLPALGGKTPIETVKMPWGKKKVAEILKQIENSEEYRKQHGESHFDPSWLWERLGLEK